MKFDPIIPGAPYFLHGGDYNPDQWLKHPEVIADDFKFMKMTGCNTFSVGIFAWTTYEPEEGVFNFDWLDQLMDQLAAHGYRALLATPSGAKPAWMAKKYPEICRVDHLGHRELYSRRHNHCWTSSVYREKVTQINTLLAERYANHPALGGWHISNEYNGDCHCPTCMDAFHKWLERKYKTLDALNHAWWTGFWSHPFTSWSEINPQDGCMDGLLLDWKRFVTWLTCDFMKHEIVPLKKITPDLPVTTNFMGLFNGLDYWRFTDICDFISDDCYPTWDYPKEYFSEASKYALLHDQHRSMKQGKPFLMMESSPSTLNWKDNYRLKRPGVHQLEMMLAMGHGAGGTMYFQWRKSRGGCEKFHGAVVDHVGNENTRVFKEVAKVGEIQNEISELACLGVDVETAVIFDWEARWALEVSSGPTRHNKKPTETVQAHYEALFGLNVPMDVIESTCDFSKYKLLVAPMLYMLKPGVAERLKEYVKQGGNLIFTYLGGYVNETNLCFLGGWPGDGLREVLGVWNEELDGFADEDVQTICCAVDNKLSLSGEYNVVDFAERIHTEGAKVLATYGHDFYAGEPALTVNDFGQGRAYYIAARTGMDFLKDFYGAIVRKIGVKTVLPESVPEGIHGAVRTDGEKDYLFLYNWNQEKVSVDISRSGKDMLSGEPVDGKLNLPGYGSTVIALD